MKLCIGCGKHAGAFALTREGPEEWCLLCALEIGKRGVQGRMLID